MGSFLFPHKQIMKRINVNCPGSSSVKHFDKVKGQHGRHMIIWITSYATTRQTVIPRVSWLLRAGGTLEEHRFRAHCVKSDL